MTSLPPPTRARDALAALWSSQGLPAEALAAVDLPGDGEPVMPTSFNIDGAIQASLGAAALAALEVHHRRSAAPRQRVAVPREHALADAGAYSIVDGHAPAVWDKLSGLYRCGPAGAPGWVRLHMNFAHHRDGTLALLGCPTGPGTERAAVQAALARWAAEDFEAAAAEAGLVVAALRSFDAWDAHPQGRATVGEPPLRLRREDTGTPAPPWPASGAGDAPLAGLRVLDLTRILAGPVAGRTLAAYGADVMLVNGPHLPNIEAIADTSRGKLSAHVDLRSEAGRATLWQLLGDADVLLHAYRPDALAALGFSDDALARRCPRLASVALSAYGAGGPWSQRRGFDSLVQTATGFNVAEAEAAGGAEPRALPVQALDYAAGHLLAFGVQAALLRRATEGGTWRAEVSLAAVGRWLRGLGRVEGGFGRARPPVEPYLETVASGFGPLVALRHPAQFSVTPAFWRRPAVPPGTDPPAWPAR